MSAAIPFAIALVISLAFNVYTILRLAPALDRAVEEAIDLRRKYRRLRDAARWALKEANRAGDALDRYAAGVGSSGAMRTAKRWATAASNNLGNLVRGEP